MKKLILLLLLFTINKLFAQDLINQNFDTSLVWTVEHLTGTSTNAGWTRVTTNNTPSCLPYSGNGMARFNSVNIGGLGTNTYSLTSPEINFSGQNYNVKFRMYRDINQPTKADKIDVVYKTALTDPGIIIGTVHRNTTLSPVVSNEGWYTYNFNLPNSISGSGYISLIATSYNGYDILIDTITVNHQNNNNLEARFIYSSSPPEVFLVNTSGNNFAIQFKNIGLNSVDSFTLNWHVDNGSVSSGESIFIPSIQSGEFSNAGNSQVPLIGLSNSPGQHTLTIWITNPNGVPDSDMSNNTLTKIVYVVNEAFPRTVVFEGGTGTWCGFCPNGHVGMKNMNHNYPNDFISIAVHNDDPMMIAEYDEGLDPLFDGFPGGAMDRTHLNMGSHYSSLQLMHGIQLGKVPLAKVTIPTQTWNPTTRVITYDVVSQFALNLNNANFKVAGVIVENGVVYNGASSSYNQRNYYYDGSLGNLIDWEGINWANLPNYVPSTTMPFNYVARALLGGFNGFENSVPTSITYNTPYTYTLTHTLPANQNANNIKLIALLIDNATGKILNAKQVPLNTSLSTNDVENRLTNYIYPNPSSGVIYFKSENPIDVSIINVYGKEVFNAEKVYTANLSHLEKGIYLVKMKDDDKISVQKIILN